MIDRRHSAPAVARAMSMTGGERTWRPNCILSPRRCRRGQAALANLRQQYEDAGPDEADVIVALGGDGFMLQTLHAFIERDKPIYGMNFGTVGFLMNEYNGTI